MNDPEPEPYVVNLPSKKFNSKSVRLADKQAAEEGKIDSPKPKKTYNKKFYYQRMPKWRQKKNANWKKASDEELEKEDTYDKPQKRISLPSKSSERWNGRPNKYRNFSKQIEKDGIIATPAKRPGEDRGQFQRSFDTFMFGSRSVLPDPPVINSGDHRLKYKSVQELVDSAAVSNKIYKHPVNDMTGTYQRSMTSARFGASSVSSLSSISPMVPVLPNKKIPNSKPLHSVPGLFEPTSTRSLINDIFGNKDPVANGNDYSPRPSLLTEDCVVQGNTLKRVRNEPSNQMESRKYVAGPISYLPPLPPSQTKAIISKDAEISHESQILDHVMTQYRIKRSNGSNDEKVLKNDEIGSGITEEQWFDIITPLDLPVMFMKEFPKNTMQALQEKNHSEKAGITIGQISNIHSTKKVLTLRDYTGEIKALIQEKVIKTYDSMLCKDTILVLKNVTIQKSEGLPPFITITLNNIYILYVDEHNKVIGYGARDNRNFLDKEKEVDAELGASIGDAIQEHKRPGIIVLVAGDGDYGPLLRRALLRGWVVEIWFWTKGNEIFNYEIKDNIGTWDNEKMMECYENLNLFCWW